jgi:hypothetical protein
VASDLALAQTELGHLSKLIVQTDSSLREDPFKNPLVTISAATDNLLLGVKPAKSQLSLLRSKLAGSADRRILATQPRILNMHWVEGVISPQSLRKLADKTSFFWTLHDMRPMTGGCHHALTCQGYTKTCSDCPMLRSLARPLSQNLLRRKLDLLSDLKITFIATSPWVKQRALESSALQNQRVVEIANPISQVFFEKTKTMEKVRSGLVFIAANIDDPNKGFIELEDWFLSKHREFPLRVIGSKRFNTNWSPIIFLGALSPSEIIDQLDATCFLILNSTSETAPLVIAEAAARGVIPLINSRLRTVISPEVLKAGCFFFDRASDLERQLPELMKNPKTPKIRQALMSAAFAIHNPTTVARKYLDFYDNEI